jgi:hypothetical protein
MNNLTDSFLKVLFGPALIVFIAINVLSLPLLLLAGEFHIAAMFVVLTAVNAGMYKYGEKYREPKDDLLAMPPKRSKA